MRLTIGFLARVYLLQQEPEGARSLLSSRLSPDTPFSMVGQRTVWQSQAEILLAQGDSAQAMQNIEGLISTAANLTHEECIPLLWKLRAEALIHQQRYDEAEATLQQAEASARKQGIRPLLWRIWLVQAKLAQLLRRHEEAEQAFARALQLIEELAADLPEQPWRATFLQQAHSQIPPHRAPFGASPQQGSVQRPDRARTRGGGAHRTGKIEPRDRRCPVVGVSTVEAHIAISCQSSDGSSRAQIASWATEKGLTSHRLT